MNGPKSVLVLAMRIALPIVIVGVLLLWQLTSGPVSVVFLVAGVVALLLQATLLIQSILRSRRKDDQIHDEV